MLSSPWTPPPAGSDAQATVVRTCFLPREQSPPLQGRRGSLGLGAQLGRGDLLTSLPSLHRPFPSEETTENDDDVYRSLEELAE